MFTPNRLLERCVDSSVPKVNWEEDIDGVILEICAQDEDPTGYRAVFHKIHQDSYSEEEDSYAVGASYLKSRLEKLRRSGFDAPMTKKAINLLDKEKIKRLS